MSKQLKPCPFCGESKFIRFVYRDYRHNMSLGERINYGVFCMEGCGAEINPIYKTKELAIKAWNTRPITPLVLDREKLAILLHMTHQDRKIRSDYILDWDDPFLHKPFYLEWADAIIARLMEAK